MTKFILKSHPQSDIWVNCPERFADHIGDLLETWQAGFCSYAENQLDAIKEALFKFQQENDTKAAVVMTLTYSSGQVGTVMTTLLLIQTNIIEQFIPAAVFFYDAPTPSGVFNDLLAIPLLREMSQQQHSLTLF